MMGKKNDMKPFQSLPFGISLGSILTSQVSAVLYCKVSLLEGKHLSHPQAQTQAHPESPEAEERTTSQGSLATWVLTA